jgi:hypothetical protein
LELLFFGFGKVRPDGGAIGVPLLTNFGQYIFNVESGLPIIAGNGSADKFQAFDRGSSI